MDCDGQHEPSRIPVLLEAIHDCDIVSGSRYLRDFRQDTPAPTDRRFINATITARDQRPLRPEPHRLRSAGSRRIAARRWRSCTSPRRLGHAAATVGAGGAAGVAGEGDRRAAALSRPEPGVRRRDERPRSSGWRIIAACWRPPSATCCRSSRDHDRVRVSGAAVMAEFRAPAGNGEVLAVPGLRRDPGAGGGEPPQARPRRRDDRRTAAAGTAGAGAAGSCWNSCEAHVRRGGLRPAAPRRATSPNFRTPASG